MEYIRGCDQAPASWKPRRIAARALLLQRPVRPRKSFVRSAEIAYQIQQGSVDFLQLPFGRVPITELSPDSVLRMMFATLMPTGVICLKRRSPIKFWGGEPSGDCGLGSAIDWITEKSERAATKHLDKEVIVVVVEWKIDLVPSGKK